MKLSETLFTAVEAQWKEACEKPFVLAMANGTLDAGKFRDYMLQDYLYLLDYVEILKKIREQAPTEETKGFLSSLIDGTIEEINNVHIPSMKENGITEEQIAQAKRLDVIVNYMAFMQKSVEDEGFLGGITALLQCCWGYAYIADAVKQAHATEVAASKFASWFEAYTCESYLGLKTLWVDMVDRECAGIDAAQTERFCKIFTTCAACENDLWDALNK